MSTMQWSYAAMLTFCLAATLPLIPALGLRALRRPGRLLLAILCGGLPFLIWDVIATAGSHWYFDPAQTSPWRVGGLPVEEIAFFIVVPLASIITLEAVTSLRHRRHTRRDTVNGQV